MRARCEHCDAAQPATWTAGDLCTACGRTVRHEVRCFWCATWTPAAAFCRTCGADVVEERLYGAARMLKDAGTDRFSVPERLYALGADRIDNFARIYQRHAAVAARHVDELHAVEQHLNQRHWSAALDDELARQLPWPIDVLERYEAADAGRSAPGSHDAADRSGLLRTIRERSPFDLTRVLAALALVAVGEPETDAPGAAHAPDVLDEARAALHHEDAAVRAEAALVLTSWRSRTSYGGPDEVALVVAALQPLTTSSSPRVRAAAAVRLAALQGRPDDLPPDDVLAADPDAAFDAALQRGDVDPLAATLRRAVDRDPVACIASARALLRAGVVAPLDAVLRGAPDVVRAEVLQAMLRSRLACDEVHDALVELAVTAADGTVRRHAVQVACRSMTHRSAMRIAHAVLAPGDESESAHRFDRSAILQSLMQCAQVGTDTVVELADLMLATGAFTVQQYGLTTVAEDGRLPDGFVPARFAAADEPTRRELLAVVERQLGRRADPALHRFALRVLFGDHPAETRAAAMWVLRRWYREQGDIRGEGPFVLGLEPIAEVFGDVPALVRGVAAVLGDDATMREVGVYEYVAHLLGTADDELIEALQRDRTGWPLVEALVAAVQRGYWPQTHDAMVTLLSRLCTRPDWAPVALDVLRRLDGAGNWHHDRAVERLEAVDQRRSITTLPTE